MVGAAACACDDGTRRVLSKQVANAFYDVAVRVELMAHDRPGFWEQHGYHDRGDPWLEQRYQGD